MRLIDGDKVEKYFEECSDKEFPYHDEYSCGLFDAYSSASEYIDSCETVDAEPVVHAHWFLLDECSNAGVYCSHCHKKCFTEKAWYANIKQKSERCPHCGAHMDEKEI